MQHITDRVKAVAHSQAGQGGVEYVLVTLLAVVVGIITAVTKSGGFEAGIQGVIEEIFGRFMDGKK